MATDILSTETITNVDIHTEALLGTYTAVAECLVLVQPRLTGMDANAAAITLRVDHATAAPASRAAQADIITLNKFADANTVFGTRCLGPVLLAAGEKLRVYGTSTNANDTAVDGTLTFINQSLYGIQAAITTGFTNADHADVEPGGGTLTTGTGTAGDADSTWLYNGSYWQIEPVSPAVGGFGLNASMKFTLGLTKRVNTVKVIAKEDMVSGVHVWAYNYLTSSWDQITSTTSWITGNTDTTYEYTLLASHQKTSDGEVQIRFTSTTTTTGKYLWIDQVLVNTVTAGSGQPTVAEIASAVASHDISGLQLEGTIGYQLKWLDAAICEVSVQDSAISFTVTGGVATASAYVGMIAVVEQTGTDTAREARRITAYTAAGVITLDRALSFTPTVGCDVYIKSTGYTVCDLVDSPNANALSAIGTAASTREFVNGRPA